MLVYRFLSEYIPPTPVHLIVVTIFSIVYLIRVEDVVHLLENMHLSGNGGWSKTHTHHTPYRFSINKSNKSHMHIFKLCGAIVRI